MKKILSNIQMLAALLMAGAAMTACSGSDELIDNPATKTYTVTVEATKSADPSTRALTGGTGTSPINFTWSAADKVEVYHPAGDKIGTLTPQTVGSTTTKLKGTVNTTYLSPNDKLHLFLRTSDRLCDYTGQDGTLEKISTNYDFAYAYNIKVTAVEGSNITLEPATFEACQAIVKFKLVDTDNNPVNATSFKIVSQEDYLCQKLNAYACNPVVQGSISVSLGTAKNEFYVALAQWTSGAYQWPSIFILTAVAGSDTYVYQTSEEKTFEAGKYYTVTVKMSKVGAGKALSEVTTADIGKVIGADGKVYDSVALATAASGSAVAMIGSVSSTGHGLALELNCHVENNYASLVSIPSSLTSISGGTWRIPTLADLQTIFQGCGASESVDITSPTADYQEFYKDVAPYLTGFWTKWVACGASNSLYWFYFITSSEDGTDKHWCVEIKEFIEDVNYYASPFSRGSGNSHYLHCVLAF